jgi:hypothetical protein
MGLDWRDNESNQCSLIIQIRTFWARMEVSWKYRNIELAFSSYRCMNVSWRLESFWNLEPEIWTENN